MVSEVLEVYQEVICDILIAHEGKTPERAEEVCKYLINEKMFQKYGKQK
jgi:hypothetical protein